MRQGRLALLRYAAFSRLETRLGLLDCRSFGLLRRLVAGAPKVAGARKRQMSSRGQPNRKKISLAGSIDPVLLGFLWIGHTFPKGPVSELQLLSFVEPLR